MAWKSSKCLACNTTRHFEVTTRYLAKLTGPVLDKREVMHAYTLLDLGKAGIVLAERKDSGCPSLSMFEYGSGDQGVRPPCLGGSLCAGRLSGLLCTVQARRGLPLPACLRLETA